MKFIAHLSGWRVAMLFLCSAAMAPAAVGAAPDEATAVSAVAGMSPEGDDASAREARLRRAAEEGKCPLPADREIIRRQQAASPEGKARDESALLRKICEMRGYDMARQVRVQVHAADIGEQPVVLDGLKSISLCTRTACRQIPLKRPLRALTGNAQGEATVVAEGEMAAGTLVQAVIETTADDRALQRQQRDLVFPLDALRLPKDVIVLLSWQRASGCSKVPCLQLAGAEAHWGKDAIPDDEPVAGYHTGAFFYNPRSGLSARLPNGIELSIPPAATPIARIVSWQSHEDELHPGLIFWPMLTLARPAQFSLPLSAEGMGERPSMPGAEGRGKAAGPAGPLSVSVTRLDAIRNGHRDPHPSSDGYGLDQEGPVPEECYLRPDDSDCSVRFLIGEMGREMRPDGAP